MSPNLRLFGRHEAIIKPWLLLHSQSPNHVIRLPTHHDERADHDLAAKLKAGQVDPSTIPPIRIVVRDGKVWTLDNRRLRAFQEAGIEIPFVRLDSIPLKELDKFTTINDGVEIIIRRRPQ